jgi:hypothetical protein
MKKSIVLFWSALFAIETVKTSNASTLADWTFESSSLASYVPGANTATTNFYADLGLEAGTAAVFGLHAGSATYSSPLGNGSLDSLCSTVWAQGDYYQFSVNLDLIDNSYSTFKVSYDQTGSSTSPKTFYFAYSLNGVNFIKFGSDYGLPSGVSWSGSSPNHATQFSDDLTSITTLDTARTIYFRIVDDSATTGGAIGGGSVGTTGSDRIDNIVVNATIIPTPEPSPLALAALIGAVCLVAFGRRH